MLSKPKLRLYEACQLYLKERLEGVESRLHGLDEALEKESKSSVGDKYETGRAMLHLEKEKQMQQLAVLLDYKKQLHAIEVLKPCSKVEQGALVFTNQGAFYLSISAGKLLVEGQVFFAITLASPIGKLLFQKQAQDEFHFRGKHYVIKDVL